MGEPRIYTAEEAEALRAAATPGPWHVLDGDALTSDFDSSLLAIDVDGLAIVDRPADATLMAAAPDLAASVVHHAQRADAAEAEVGRLRDLVHKAYAEGWHDAPYAGDDDDVNIFWQKSDALADLDQPR